MFQEQQVICPTKSLFTPGMYIRNVLIPRNTFLTTEIHKTEHPFALMSGSVSVYNVDTDEVERIEAPYIGITTPGTRRVAYAHEDSIWVTFHATDLTDVEEIAKNILVDRPEVIPQYKLKNILKLKTES